MFVSIDPRKLEINPFEAIGDNWMLITAKNGDGANPMTASWGGMGVIWGELAVTCYIRPQRFTRELADDSEYFSLCFFEPGEQRDALNKCGTLSGRDTDKVALTGLTVLNDKAAPYFAEASTVFICRKAYRQEMKSECFIDKSMEKHYANGDYHIMYIGVVEECLTKE